VLDSGVPDRDALECVICLPLARPPSGWRRPPGRPRQIVDSSAASVSQEWDLAVGRGHSRRTRSALGPPPPKRSDMMTMMMLGLSFLNLATHNVRNLALRTKSIMPLFTRVYVVNNLSV